MTIATTLSTDKLSKYGITGVSEIVYNPSYDTLFAEEMAPGLQGFEKGIISESGAVAVDTGIFTGRSPKDKYIVKDDTTRDTIWWSDQGKNDNKAIDQSTWDYLKEIVTEDLCNKRLFAHDCNHNVFVCATMGHYL